MDDLDRWTRVLPLGSGAFGEVHLAWDNVDGRWVALKRFTGQDELGLLRMVIESRIRVSHPNLVRTLAFRLVDDRAWLVTELARGGSLRALAARGPLPWGWVVEAVDQILTALTALHATGVVHRDLKPANLLLGSVGARPPHLLVGDFGIATWRTVSMTGIGAAIGTPGYLAPEYLDGHQPSPATDLFAVGVLAAELLAGRRLVHYSNASPSLPSSWSEELPVPADVPAPVAAVLRRMAAPNPAWRYVDCTQAREALLAVAPPAFRGDLTTVPVPDLLASVPPGWTPEGPDQPTTTLATTQPQTPPEHKDSPTPKALPKHEDAPEQEVAREQEAAPKPDDPEPMNLVGLPIDGGPTALVLDTPPTEQRSGSSTSPPSGSATSLPASPIGSSTHPVTGSSTQPPGDPATSLPAPVTGSPTHPDTGSPTQPPSDPATSQPTPPTGSSTHPATGSSTSLPALPTGSPTHPPTGSPTHPPTGSSTQPPSDPATPQPAPPTGPSTHPDTGSPTQPPSDPATPQPTPPTDSGTHPPSGSPIHPPSGSATAQPNDGSNPPAGSQSAALGPALAPAGPLPTPAGGVTPPPAPADGSSALPSSGSATSGAETQLVESGPAAAPVGPPSTPAGGLTAQAPSATSGSSTSPPSGSATSSKAERKARRRRKAKRAALLVVLLIVVGGAGAVWWTVTHRTVPGHASATGGPTSGPAPTSRWEPTVLEPCSAVERGRERSGTNGTERCQRTKTTDEPQHWVEEPPGGFPTSDAAGPFPGETCTTDGDKQYSPVGDHVECIEKTWQVIA